VLLDVSAKEEVETVKLQRKHHFTVLEIPFHELPSRISELPKDKFIGVFFSSGVRSTIAFAYLKSSGYENVNIVEGGYYEFMQAILPGNLFKHLNK
jgi:rhodanese-related sulfurtransferase